MACSCSKKGMRNITPPRAGLAPAGRNVTPSQTPTTLRALSQSAPPPERSPAGMTAERRRVEKNRRDAIKRKLGK